MNQLLAVDSAPPLARRLLGAVTAALLAAGAIAAAVVGASPDDSGASTLAVGQSVPAATLTAASEAISQVSYRMEGTTTATVPDTASQQFDVKFEYDATTRRLGGSMSLPFGQTVRTVIDRNTIYIEVPAAFASQAGGKRWTRTNMPEDGAAQFDQFGALSGTRILDEAVAKGGATVTYAGRGRVRGDAADHYLIKANHDGLTTSGDVWIDDEGRFRKARLTMSGRLGDVGKDMSLVSNFEVFDLGADVNVELPPESEVYTPDHP